MSSSQTPTQASWSQGTADAIRHFAWLLETPARNRLVGDVLVLAADQLYNADFTPVIEQHRATGAGQC